VHWIAAQAPFPEKFAAIVDGAAIVQNKPMIWLPPAHIPAVAGIASRQLSGKTWNDSSSLTGARNRLPNEPVLKTHCKSAMNGFMRISMRTSGWEASCTDTCAVRSGAASAMAAADSAVARSLTESELSTGLLLSMSGPRLATGRLIPSSARATRAPA